MHAPGRRNRLAAFFAAGTLLVAVPVLAQQPDGSGAPGGGTGSVTGFVVSADGGTPISGATIEVDGLSRGVLSDARGHYFLGRLPAGELTLRFSHLGYRDRVETVQLQRGEKARVIVSLTSEPIALSGVLVLMERTRMVGDPLNDKAIPGSAHFLSRADLEAQNLAFDNAHSVLRQVPGVNVQDEDAYGLRPNIGLRGTGVDRSAKITVMEDGVLAAPAPYAAPAAYYFPVVGRMDAVEVRKGSSQVKYGPRTIGGAINLVSTPIPEAESAWFADISGGQDATVKGQGWIGGSSDHFGWLFETYQIDTDGFKELASGARTGFRIQDYVGKIRLNSDRNAATYQELQVKFGYYDELSDETYLGVTDTDFERSPLLRYPASQADVMDADHTQLMARYFIRPGGGFDWTTTLYRNDFARNWYKLQSVLGTNISSVLSDPGANGDALAVLKGADSEADALKVRANNREYFSQGIQTTLGFRFEPGVGSHNLEVGLRYHEDEEDRFQHEDGFRMEAGSVVQTSAGAPGSQSNRVTEAQAVAAYVQDEIEMGRWTVVPGLRYETVDFTRIDYANDDPGRAAPERVRENSVDALIPGVGVSFAIDRVTHLFGGVHRGFGPPGAGADEATDPEESVNYELGARIRRNGLAAQLAGFFSDYTNILGKATLATGESGLGDQFNGGEVNVWGAEVSADYDLAWQRELPFRLPVRLAYTFTQAEFQTAFESDYDPWGTVEAGDELPYLPEHQYSASLGVASDRWSLNLAAQGASSMRTVAGQGDIAEGQGTDAYVALNLTGEWTLPTWGTLYAGVQNLTDEAYIVARRPAGARPGLPRTFITGFRVRR